MSDVVSRPWAPRVAHHETWPLDPRSSKALASSLRRVARKSAPVGMLVLAALVVIGVGAFLFSGSTSRPAAAPRAEIAPSARWIDIGKPVQIFSLEAPLLGRNPPAYTARRWSAGGAREDMLAFGAFGDDRPMLRLKLQRGKRRELANTPLFTALAREAAESDLAVERSGLPGLLPTRFGRFKIADVRLSGGETPPKTMSCSGFRLILDQPELSISGLACDGRDGFSRKDLACLVDRLDLSSGGDDKPLVDVFATSELHRNPDCAGARLGPDHLHAAWLDDKPATPRKHLRRH